MNLYIVHNEDGDRVALGIDLKEVKRMLKEGYSITEARVFGSQTMAIQDLMRGTHDAFL